MIIYQEQAYEPNPQESVLDCLLRHGVVVPSFCRSGVCQTCVLKVVEGQPPAKAQAGLKEAWKRDGLVLSCVCDASEPLSLAPADAVRSFESRVVNVTALSERVRCVMLDRPSEFEFRAGQFVQLQRPDTGVARPYSIASLPTDNTLEFHVAIQPGGALSPWFDDAVGKPITIHGPYGECVYMEDEPDRPMLLAGTGTGLAPLLGVLRAALRANHRGPIFLYHGARDLLGLYYLRQLHALAAEAPNLQVRAVALQIDDALQVDAARAVDAASQIDAARGHCHVEQADLGAVVAQYPGKADEVRAYLCGDPTLVGLLKKRLYLAGASLARIHSDPFLPPAANPPSP